MCGHRHTPAIGYNQGRLGEETLLEKCLLCVIGNDNDSGAGTTCCGAFAPKQSWDLCGHDVSCSQFSALQKWAD